MSPLRLTLIGLGRRGSQHLSVFRALPDVELLGVLDPHTAWDGHSYKDLDAVLADQPDAVVVATSVGSHEEIVGAALRKGVHVLVEKPFTADLDSARRLVRLAQQSDRLLVVGFAERFNEQLAGLPAQMRSISTRRWLTAAPRDPAVNVMLDLAVHDIDLVRFHTGSEYARCNVRVLGHDALGRAEEAVLEGVLQNGIEVGHHVSWIRLVEERTVTWSGPFGDRTANMLGPHRSLVQQATAFAVACTTGRVGALAQGADGTRALSVLRG